MTLNKNNIDSGTDKYDIKNFVNKQRKSRQELEYTEENKIYKLCEEIYLKLGNYKGINDIVGNYASFIRGILNIFDNEEVYDKGIIKLEKLLSGEINFEEFSEIVTNEKNLIEELILKYSIEDEKDKIIEEFIKII